MKLKYYLRGLGVGIVVTAFVSSIANGIGGNSLTTEQVILKAKELGMVTQDDYDAVNSDLTDAKESIEDLQNQLNDQNTTANEETSDTENLNNSTNGTNETNDANETNALTSDNSTTTETYIEGSTSESTTVEFDITPGMSSNAVSKLLEEKGIIADAADFNQYVIDSGKVNNLQVGRYKVSSGESYDSIISKLTNSE